MRLSLTNLVCVLFDPAIPTSSFNFIQLFLYLLELLLLIEGRVKFQFENVLREYSLDPILWSTTGVIHSLVRTLKPGPVGNKFSEANHGTVT